MSVRGLARDRETAAERRLRGGWTKLADPGSGVEHDRGAVAALELAAGGVAIVLERRRTRSGERATGTPDRGDHLVRFLVGITTLAIDARRLGFDYAKILARGHVRVGVVERVHRSGWRDLEV